ncbi:MAG: PQQ-dependent sugar dehydrogenase [Planctomycetales bacterium]|nr:PQQ-dependent sugar dehydrogenase [Planctomycetales bacterium]
MKIRNVFMAIALFGLTSLSLVRPANGENSIVATRIASGLDRPVFATFAPGHDDHLFIVEQHSGSIQVLDLNSLQLQATPLLEINNLSRSNEQGLLGLAFDPDFVNSGQFYINYTDSSGTTRLERYSASSDNSFLADPNSAETLLTIRQPQSNHNAGWLGFSPSDGYLYMATGDGGGANDSANGHTAGIGNSQDTTNNLLGKMLRLDVNRDDFPADANRNYGIPNDNPFVGSDGDDEIWAYGLRNPWRNSFDRDTGDLYIADVGQAEWEEVNFQPAGVSGANYGWRLREADIATPQVGGPEPADHVTPIHAYAHDANGGFSITGGYVYRGPIEELQGEYFFADFVSNRIWSLQHDGSQATSVTDQTTAIRANEGGIGSIASFAEDAAGNLYILSLDGDIFRLDDIIDVTTIVPSGANWSYLDDGSNQGTAWRETLFDDSNWKQAAAQFGYGDGDEATVISFGPSSSAKFVTSYFRHEFDIANPDTIQTLELGLLYDDGAAVYLNGVEVVRTENLAPDAKFDSLANFQNAGAQAGADEDTFFPFAIDASLLVEGRNVLAVEVHQASRSSSDLSFDLSLSAVLGLEGDFNSNGELDVNDLDLLSERVRSGSLEAQFDLDGDGELTNRDREVWIFDLRQTWVGDSNWDGEFSTSDLVAVFQVGEYEDDLPLNSTWAEGDWDGDGDFTSSDLVYLFQSLGDVIGPRPQQHSVPEPNGIVGMFLVLGVGLHVGRRRHQ